MYAYENICRHSAPYGHVSRGAVNTRRDHGDYGAHNRILEIDQRCLIVRWAGWSFGFQKHVEKMGLSIARSG